MLHHVVHGEAPGTPLVIAHGLFGSARNWGAMAKRLSDERRVIAVDMRNHGLSPWDDDHGYEAQARDLADVIAQHGGHADVLGHSMGGKAAMVLALRHPERVRALVVADIAPRPYSHSQMPLVEALRAVDLSAVERRSDAEAQLEVDDPAVRAFLLQSLDAPNGRWRLNLDALAANMDAIMGWPAPEATWDGPATVIRGGASGYVPDADLPAIRTLFPRARLETVDGAGHWLHAEAPRPFEAAVRRALEPPTA